MAKKRYYESDMISQPSNTFANVPQQVVHKTYPKAGAGATDAYNDSRSGVDGQIGRDTSGMRGQKNHDKY